MNCTVDDVAPRYQKNIKRFLLNQENIEASLRALFGKWRAASSSEWEGKKKEL